MRKLDPRLLRSTLMNACQKPILCCTVPCAEVTNLCLLYFLPGISRLVFLLVLRWVCHPGSLRRAALFFACASALLHGTVFALVLLLFCSAMVLSHFETKTEPQARLFSRPLSISARPLHWEVCGGGLQHPAPPTFLVVVAHGALILRYVHVATEK